MKKTVRILLRFSMISVFLAVMVLISFAQDIQKLPADTKKLRTEADLSVNAIFATPCKCKADLEVLDVLYLDSIIVEVGKRDIRVPPDVSKEPSFVVGTLTVTYHDLLAGRLVTHTMMISNYNFTAGSGDIHVIKTPVLVKKSAGIRAEIKLNSPAYANVDPNPANNVKTIKDCVTLLR